MTMSPKQDEATLTPVNSVRSPITQPPLAPVQARFDNLDELAQQLIRLAWEVDQQVFEEEVLQDFSQEIRNTRNGLDIIYL